MTDGYEEEPSNMPNILQEAITMMDQNIESSDINLTFLALCKKAWQEHP